MLPQTGHRLNHYQSLSMASDFFLLDKGNWVLAAVVVSPKSTRPTHTE